MSLPQHTFLATFLRDKAPFVRSRTHHYYSQLRHSHDYMVQATRDIRTLIQTQIRNTHAYAYIPIHADIEAMLNVIWHSILGQSLISGKEKLGVPQNENVSLVLESDGTQVEDGEYFKTLGNNTILLLLRHGERWCPTGVDIIRAGRWKGRLHPSILGEISSLVERFKVEATWTTENFKKMSKENDDIKDLKDYEISGSHGIL